MYRIILIISILIYMSISLNAMERLKSLKQLNEHKFIFLVFEKNGCPWCVKYKNELDYIEADNKPKVKFFKVKKGSSIFTELRKKQGYNIIVYPMTYILKQEKNKSKRIHEIYGYQTEEYIEKLLKTLD